MQTLPVRAEQGIGEIVRVQSPSLSQVNAGTGTNVYSQAVIAKLLLDTTGYFGVSWTKAQVTECAALWSSEYYWMSMAEIKHFLSKCKIGEYSKTDYRHLSPFQFMGWLSEYTDALLIERRQYVQEREAAERHEREQARLTSPDMMAFDAVKAFQALGKDKEEAQELAAAKGLTQAQKDEIYRQEKIRQRQRDMLLRNGDNPKSDAA